MKKDEHISKVNLYLAYREKRQALRNFNSRLESYEQRLRQSPELVLREASEFFM